MIVLKIILWVILAVLGVALAAALFALILPATVDVSFIGGKLKYKVKFAFISLIDSNGRGLLKNKIKKLQKLKTKKPEPEPEEEEEEDLYDTEEVYDIDIENIEDEEDIDIDISIDEDIEENGEEEEEQDEEEKERSEKIRKIKEKKSKKDAPEDNRNPIAEKAEMLVNIWDIAGRPMLKIFRGFHVKNIYIDFIVADEDAFKCAINYGIISNVTYNLLAWLGELFTVSYKTVDIRSGFSLKKSQWDASFKVNFRLYTLAFSAVWFMSAYLFKIMIPQKMERKKSGK